VHTDFWWGDLIESCHVEDLSVDRNIILKWIIKKWEGVVMSWIVLAQDRDRWWAVVNVVMNLHIPKNAENFLAICGIVTFSRRPLLHRITFVCLCSLKIML
jgi:hypothetical protein